MSTHWVDKVKLPLLIIGLACIGLSAWWLNSSRTPPMPQDGGVWDLGLLTESSETSMIASRSLSNWVQSRKHVKKFVLKWRVSSPSPGNFSPGNPSPGIPSPGWCQQVYTYNRSKGTLKVECFLSNIGTLPSWVYGNVTEKVLSQVASRPRGSLLDVTLVRQLGCSYTYRDLHTGETRTFPPL